MRYRRISLLTLLLLFAASLRLSGIIDFPEWPDELYTVWNSSGSWSDRLVRIDPYWPPLHGYVVWGWRQIAGDSLEVQRFLSVMMSLLTVAFLYRAARALPKGSHTIAFTAALAYAVMGYSIFTGVDVRGYGLLLLFLALSLWMTLRWLRAPTLRRAALVALSIAGMLHSGFSAPAFIALLTLWVLLLKPRLFPRWIGIGAVVFVLVLPIIPQFLGENVLGRFSVIPPPLPPFFEAMAGIYRDFGGSLVFLGLLLLAGVGLLAAAARFPRARPVALLLLLWVLFPALLYVTVGNRDFWRPRYMWWVLPGLALFIGYAVLALRPALRLLPLGALVLLPLVPVDDSSYRLAVTVSPPFRYVFSWFADHIRPGDVLVIDPYCTCGEPYGWDYFVPQYFPTGYLPIVDHPDDAPRVWYLSTEGWERDEALFAAVQEGRRASIFAGPWFFLLRLYEGAPDRAGVAFGDRVRLHGVEIEGSPTAISEYERLDVKLWWSAAEALDADYSFSLAVLDGSGRVVAQHDGPAQAEDTPGQTSAWQPGTIYEDFRTLQLPGGLEMGEYRLVVTVYQWWDGARLTPERDALENDYMLLKTLRVVSF